MEQQRVEKSFEEEMKEFISNYKARPAVEIKDNTLYMGIQTRRGNVEFFVKENGTLKGIEAVVSTVRGGSIGLNSISKPYEKSSYNLPNHLVRYEINDYRKLPLNLKYILSKN